MCVELFIHIVVEHVTGIKLSLDENYERFFLINEWAAVEPVMKPKNEYIGIESVQNKRKDTMQR